MLGRLINIYGTYQSTRGVLGGMPVWARWIVVLAALPGVALILLSLVALCVSILALLLLCVPVYRLLRWATGDAFMADEDEPSTQELLEAAANAPPGMNVETFIHPQTASEPPRTARRHVEVKIIDQPPPSGEEPSNS